MVSLSIADAAPSPDAKIFDLGVDRNGRTHAASSNRQQQRQKQSSIKEILVAG